MQADYTFSIVIKSITAHIAGIKNKKQTNVKSLKISKTSYKLHPGQSTKIKAVRKGICDIYIYARNGCMKKVKVTVN